MPEVVDGPRDDAADAGRSFYRVDVHVWCTPDQLVELKSAIAAVLCPDLEHDGPCRIPWEILSNDEDVADVPPDVIAEIRNFHPDAGLPD